MEKIKSARREKKPQNIKGKLLSNQLTTWKKTKPGRLSLHENWMRTFVLRIFVCFSRHIALVCRALNKSQLFKLNSKNCAAPVHNWFLRIQLISLFVNSWHCFSECYCFNVLGILLAWRHSENLFFTTGAILAESLIFSPCTISPDSNIVADLVTNWNEIALMYTRWAYVVMKCHDF